MKQCDFCEEVAKYDGKTVMGPWANMCAEHMMDHGYPGNDGLVTMLPQAMLDPKQPSVMSYDAWVERVNELLNNMCGLSLDDLPDTNTHDAWEMGELPIDFAEKVYGEASSF